MMRVTRVVTKLVDRQDMVYEVDVERETGEEREADVEQAVNVVGMAMHEDGVVEEEDGEGEVERKLVALVVGQKRR